MSIVKDEKPEKNRKEVLLDKYHQITLLQFFALGKRRGFVGRVGRPVENPSSGQGRVLACLKLKDGISTKNLAQILGMRVSSLNELLAKMEKAGYIERRPSEEDKRVMLVFVTKQGEEVQQSEPLHSPFDSDPFEGFSDDELQTLEVFLDRMIANLEASIGDDELAHLREKREERKEYLREQFGHSSEAFAKISDDFLSFHRGAFSHGVHDGLRHSHGFEHFATSGARSSEEASVLSSSTEPNIPASSSTTCRTDSCSEKPEGNNE